MRLRVILTKRPRPQKHLLLLTRRTGHQKRNRLLTTDPPPQVRAGIKPNRSALALRLPLILFTDLLDLLLDIRERVERDIRDLVLDAVLLQPESAAGEQDVRFARSGQVRHPVADEDDERDGAVFSRQLGVLARLGDGQRLVVAELRVVSPDRLPLTAILGNLRLVRDDLDMAAIFLAQERVKDFPEDGLQAGGDDVEGDVVREAVFVESLEVGVDLEGLLHHFEAVFEGDIEGSPHLFRNFAEGAFAGLDLLIEDLAALGAAAVGIEEDVTSVLHEDCAIEVWGLLLDS